MGRGRGKGRKATVVASHEDLIGDVEGPLPAYRRRGRQQKATKVDAEDEEPIKMEGEGEDVKPTTISIKENNGVATEIGRKRNRKSEAKPSSDSASEDNGSAAARATSVEDSTKANGFTGSRNRRKGTPRRAAEAGVECN